MCVLPVMALGMLGYTQTSWLPAVHIWTMYVQALEMYQVKHDYLTQSSPRMQNNALVSNMQLWAVNFKPICFKPPWVANFGINELNRTLYDQTQSLNLTLIATEHYTKHVAGACTAKWHFELQSDAWWYRNWGRGEHQNNAQACHNKNGTFIRNKF